MKQRRKSLKEQGFQKPPDLYALKPSISSWPSRKTSCSGSTPGSQRQMQEYGIIKQNVDGILRTTRWKEQVQER